LTDIASALTGFDFIRRTIKRVSELQKDNETLTAVNDALTRLGELQDKLYELRDAHADLQVKNRALEEKLAKRTEWETRRSGYKLVETSGGAHVYQNDGPPIHYACPACMERGEIHVLQNRRVATGAWACPGCDKQYPVSASKPWNPPPTSRGGGWVTR